MHLDIGPYPRAGTATMEKDKHHALWQQSHTEGGGGREETTRSPCAEGEGEWGEGEWAGRCGGGDVCFFLSSEGFSSRVMMTP